MNSCTRSGRTWSLVKLILMGLSKIKLRFLMDWLVMIVLFILESKLLPLPLNTTFLNYTQKKICMNWQLNSGSCGNNLSLKLTLCLLLPLQRTLKKYSQFSSILIKNFFVHHLVLRKQVICLSTTKKLKLTYQTSGNIQLACTVKPQIFQVFILSITATNC